MFKAISSHFNGTWSVHFYIWVEFKIKASPSWLSGMHIALHPDNDLALELIEQIAFIRFDSITSQNVYHQMKQLKK